MTIRGGVVSAVVAVCLGAGSVSGQQQGSAHWAPTTAALRVSGHADGPGRPTLMAQPVQGDQIRIDGRAIEDAWQSAPAASDFVQYEPAEGQSATERTEARVLYGRNALYVAIRAWDKNADEIVGQLTRRDQESYSDQVGVIVDSYFDKRTAFQFAVNPAGVKQDVYRFDDTGEDSGWDAVWDVATSRDDQGWTAEFRIPYSQLRFRDADVQTWGINFIRIIARRDETDVWAPTTRQDAAVVSRFGELHGIRGVDAKRRAEIMPYTVARLERTQGDGDNPFYSKNATFGTMGADLKYGVTSDLTLDVTLNPDFGQVEADPAEVNLSAFETFYSERRPFFVEGSSIYRFSITPGDGDNSSESLFYSRRIGRAPQGSPDDQGGWVDMNQQTTILGAAKLSGKTASGWSIGALQALTSQETARIAPASGAMLDEAVEPRTSYSMLRLQKDFRGGRSAVGMIGTAVNRDPSVADALELRSRAFTGGVDFRHRFSDDQYEVSGYLLGSHVMGSAAAMDATQRSAVHYFQRPDADYLTYDPTRTSLDGASLFLTLGRIRSEHWRWSTGYRTRTPGFEVNDMGYQRGSDFHSTWAWAQYQQTTPQGPFRRYSVNFNWWGDWNYGGDRTSMGGNVNGNFQLKNFWNGYAGGGPNWGSWSQRTLRGGPLFKRDDGTNFWAGFGSDSRKAVAFNLSTWGNVRPQSDSWGGGVSPHVRFRPSGRATFSVGTSIDWNVDDYQWIGEYGSTDTRYVFGRIDQTTVGLTARVDYAFTPTLSLQLYAQPFVSAGKYTDFKRVADPRADRYQDRFDLLDATISGDQVVLDADGDGTPESLDRPDFNFKQFRSNAVLRWEYRPGSVLFVVWSQGRNDFIENGAFHLGGDMRDLFSVHPDNVFMVKLSYWLSR